MVVDWNISGSASEASPNPTVNDPFSWTFGRWGFGAPRSTLADSLWRNGLNLTDDRRYFAVSYDRTPPTMAVELGSVKFHYANDTTFVDSTEFDLYRDVRVAEDDAAEDDASEESDSDDTDSDGSGDDGSGSDDDDDAKTKKGDA